ncbi:DUF4123 domain-containing protein [Herbaspirillum sp. C7C8]|uniref:DUF4123 domain-containing protein n=1 Tax=Herbaspirillum sp. C7C8 TaxID=2736665 RepID=UPI001F51807A|nr:DUF4123 domain-containing protein [Herbaspirillum sp. C7C8]MCI1005946.1 DUF4123 domain-containing protein [Herbaspirillum sp. C7C8]
MSDVHDDPLALLHWAQACRERGHQAFLLLDTAQAEASHLKLQSMHVPYTSLFEGKREEALPEIAPLLLPLSGLDEQRALRLVRWISQLGFGAPCLSWYESSLGLHDFAAHLRNFHHVSLSDGQVMMMRWYDTRILPIWIQALSKDQLALFTGGMLSLAFVDRFGEARTLYQSAQIHPPSQALPLDAPLVRLDDRQFVLLVDAGDLDALLTHLRFVIPDETNALPTRTLVEFVATYQQRARDAGVDDIDRQTQYVLLALYTSGIGVEHLAVKALMQHPPDSLAAYFDALQEMPGEVWEAGPPLWENEHVA